MARGGHPQLSGHSGGPRSAASALGDDYPETETEYQPQGIHSRGRSLPRCRLSKHGLQNKTLMRTGSTVAAVAIFIGFATVTPPLRAQRITPPPTQKAAAAGD